MTTATATRAMEIDYLVTPTRLRVIEADASPTGRRQMQGCACPYGKPANLGFYEEQVKRGAFDKSIREAALALPLLLWHNQKSWSIGKAIAWDSRLDGLYGTWDLDDSDDAQRAADLADPEGKGMMSGLSIGFSPLNENVLRQPDWEAGVIPLVEITEGRLVEVSLVSTPAYQDAVVTSVRSASASHRMPMLARRAVATPKLAEWKQIAASLRP